MPIVDIKGVGKAQFPDGMSADSIRDFLRKKYAQQSMNGESDILARQPSTAQPYEPTLSERMGQGVSDALYNSGLVSDRYGAQQVGGTISSIGEMLPGIGDATAGDEFGRAVATGDKVGMGIGLLGAIPIAGDALKKGIRKSRMDFVYKNNPSMLNKNNTLSDSYSSGKDDFTDGLSDEQIAELDAFENSGWANSVQVDLSESDAKRVVNDLNTIDLYHGSPNEEIERLSLESNGSLFLTHDKSAADYYAEGGKIYRQGVNVRKPFFVESTDLTADMENTSIFSELIYEGYDSIVPLDKGDVVILSSEALK